MTICEYEDRRISGRYAVEGCTQQCENGSDEKWNGMPVIAINKLSWEIFQASILLEESRWSPCIYSYLKVNQKYIMDPLIDWMTDCLSDVGWFFMLLFPGCILLHAPVWTHSRRGLKSTYLLLLCLFNALSIIFISTARCSSWTRLLSRIHPSIQSHPLIALNVLNCSMWS